MVRRERDPKKTTLHLPSSQLTYSLYYLDGVRAEKGTKAYPTYTQHAQTLPGHMKVVPGRTAADQTAKRTSLPRIGAPIGLLDIRLRGLRP